MNQISFGPLANFNNTIPWGIWVGIYIWLIGISAGSFLLVAIGNLKNNPYLKKITLVGILLSLSTLLAGLLSILIDLGHIERFYKLFISPNPSSVMAWMVWLYSVYFIILVICLAQLKKRIKKGFLIFSFIFSLAIIVVESLLFALPPGRHWHSLLFVLHFLTSSLASSIAALVFVVGILWAKAEKLELLKGLSKIALPIIVINLIVEAIEILHLGNISHIESGFLLLGNIAAISLLLKHNPITIPLAGVIELIDVFFSKYNSLISSQIIEPFKGFGNAYLEPLLQFNYTPTAFEYAVCVFLIGLTACLFYFLYKVLPFTKEA